MKHIIIGTAGHIDHGKTSLIKMLTGIDCDTHKEEKSRGITINLGFSHIELSSGNSAGIIDVPGHSDFINAMISGACGIDLVLLVIAADEGIMPQTTEHLNIISSLGIKQGIVVLTKIDLVDDELIEIAKSEVSDFLKNTVIANAPIIGVSSTTASGKDELIAAIEKSIESFNTSEPSNNFRMFIDRLFTVKGYGSVVTGSVLDGIIKTGEEVFLIPGNKEKYRIRSIERHGKTVDSVQKGDRAAINLIGLKIEDFIRGMLISNKKADTTLLIDAYISGFESGTELGLWTDIIFLSGTYSSAAKMHLLNKDKLSPNDSALVQIHLNKEFAGEPQDRFIYRNSSDNQSLGGGYIIDNQPLHHRRRNSELSINLLKLANGILAENSIPGNILRIISKEPHPFDIDYLCEKLGLAKTEIIGSILIDNNDIVVYNSEIFVYKRFDTMFKQKLLNSIADFHKKNYLSETGVEAGELIGKLGLRKTNSTKLYTELLLKSLKAENKTDNFRKTWIIKGHKAIIDAKIQSEIDWLENEFSSCDDEKLVISEIEEKANAKGINAGKIRQYLSYLVGESKLVIFDSDYIHTQVFEKNQKIILQYLNTRPNGINIPEYKEVIAGTKKFRGLISDILEKEGLIKFSKDVNNESILFITEKGKSLLK